MKRYDLHQCSKSEAECDAEMMESSIGDWVQAVEAINTIGKLRIALDNINEIIGGVYIHNKELIQCRNIIKNALK